MSTVAAFAALPAAALGVWLLLHSGVSRNLERRPEASRWKTAATPLVGGIGIYLGLVAGVGLQGVATAAYIGAQLGRGPRDGLMTGLSRRTGRSLRMVCTAMELTVVAVGLVLGGVAGLGTIVYALAIGPLSQALLPAFIVETSPRR